MTAQPNNRPCGSCRHLDSRVRDGRNWCWQWYLWQRADDVVGGCDKAARADGSAPPGRIFFNGERR